MTSVPVAAPRTERGNGGLPARVAMLRWARRLFAREWRQQLAILGLVVMAVAATIVGSAVATNTPPSPTAGFGTAGDAATYPGTDAHLAATVGSLQRRFGRVDVIENEDLHVPGSVLTYELRALDPHGDFGQPMLSLVSGRYPSGSNEVAMTTGLLAELGLAVGDAWHEGGATRQIVGVVENPQSLLDEFALVAPGQVAAPTQVTVLFDAPGLSPASIGPTVQTPASVAKSNPLNPETLSLAVLTIGMLLIALVAIGGFTVLAQRRTRSFGVLSSIGATDRHLRLVVRANGAFVGVLGASLGAVLGVVLWLAYRPSLEQSAHHAIPTFALPWLVVASAVVLAVVATSFASSRPARSITRVSVVESLSGRPAPPPTVGRSAVPGVALLVVAFLLLGYSGGTAGGTGNRGSLELVLGLVVLIPAVILLAPFSLSVLARLGGRAPIATRIALRDLARYRARSGSALAAISIGVLIAVVIATAAASRYGNFWDPAGPNLATNQLLVTPNIGPNNPTPTQLRAETAAALGMGRALGARHVVELDDSSVSLQSSSGRYLDETVYVATPQLLGAFGITSAQVRGTDLLTSLGGLAGASGVEATWCRHLVRQGPPGNFNCTSSGVDTDLVIHDAPTLPSGVHAPNTVITEHALDHLGVRSQVSVQGWLLQSVLPFTALQVHNAQTAAAAAGLSVESKNDEPTSSEIVDWATLFGIVLALSVLAMSVGLIRSETSNDLRTLAATGASSFTRRALTAATAGALGLLGAVIGTFAGYVAIIGWLRNNSLNGGISSLGNVPVANLVVILLGMPALAAAAAWLLAGREPPAMARQPME